MGCHRPGRRVGAAGDHSYQLAMHSDLGYLGPGDTWHLHQLRGRGSRGLHHQHIHRYHHFVDADPSRSETSNV